MANNVVFYKDKTEAKTVKCVNSWLAFFAGAVIVAVAGVAIATIFVAADQNALQRYCIDINNGSLIGAYSLNNIDRSMSWEFQYLPTILNTVQAIQIKGPIPTGSLDGPLTISLCGMPSSLVCDKGIAGELFGTIYHKDPGDLPLTTIINEMRAQIWRYYIEFNDGITTVRAPLNMICGTP